MFDVIPIPNTLLHTADVLATMRYESNERAGSAMTHHYYDKKDVERDGILAELVFGMWLGIWPGNVFGTRPDDGADYVLNRWRVDVKGSPLHKGGLIALQHKQLSSVDIYAFVVVRPKVCHLAGWAWARDLLRKDNLKWLGKTTEHYIQQADLYPMLQLRQVLKEGKP